MSILRSVANDAAAAMSDVDDIKHDVVRLERAGGGLRRGLGGQYASTHFVHRRHHGHAEDEEAITAAVARTLLRKYRSGLSQRKWQTFSESAFNSSFKNPFSSNGADCYGGLADTTTGSGYAFGLLSVGNKIVYNGTPSADQVDNTRQTQKVLLRSVIITGRWTGNTQASEGALLPMRLRMLHGKYHCNQQSMTGTSQPQLITPAFLMCDYYHGKTTDTLSTYQMGYWSTRPQRPCNVPHRWDWRHQDIDFAPQAVQNVVPVATGVVVGASTNADKFGTIALDVPGIRIGPFRYECHPNCVLAWDESIVGDSPMEPHVILFQCMNWLTSKSGSFTAIEIFFEWQDYLADE